MTTLYLQVNLLVLVLQPWIEGRVRTWLISIFSFNVVLAVVFLLSNDLLFSICLALLFYLLVSAGSYAKLRALGFKLIYSDVPNLSAITVRTLLSDFRMQTMAGLAVFLMFLALVWSVRGSSMAFPQSLLERLGLLLAWTAAFVGSVFALNGRRVFHPLQLSARRAYFSTFFMSCFGFAGSMKPRFSTISSTALTLPEAKPETASAPESVLPDVFLILHESTFDPRLHGLYLPEELHAFFDDPQALRGRMAVDIFGGGTWQSEFNIYAGIPSVEFGLNSRFVFHLLTGKLNHSLPQSLNALGYRSLMVSSDEKPLTTHERFYRSIGFTTIDYPARYLTGEKLDRWWRQRHDRETYDCALRLLAEQAGPEHPVFLSIMTYMNHGDHRPRRFPPDLHEALREDVLSRTGNPHYAEYCVRLKESVIELSRLRKALAARASGRPALLLRYGDHQPLFVAKIRDFDVQDPALYTTFYACEMIGGALQPVPGLPDDLHSAYVATVALAAGGVPLDPIHAARLGFAKKCGFQYAECDAEEKGQFHRRLIDDGLIRIEQ